jgi:hypothetical protein
MFMAAALTGSVETVEKLLGKASISAVMFSTIVSGVMRHHDIFLTLGKIRPAILFHDHFLGLMDPRSLMPFLKDALNTFDTIILVLDHYNEKNINQFVHKPSESITRIAVHWRCWSALRTYLDIRKVTSICAADFVVTRAARVIQRTWRERRRRCEQKCRTRDRILETRPVGQ